MKYIFLISAVLFFSSLTMKEFTYNIPELGFSLRTEKELKIEGPSGGTYIWIKDAENKYIGGIWRRNNKFSYDDFKELIVTQNGVYNNRIIEANGKYGIHKVQEGEKVHYYKYHGTTYYNFVFWGTDQKELEHIQKSFFVNEAILESHFQRKIDFPFTADSVVTFFNGDIISRDSANIFTVNIDRNVYNEPHILVHNAYLYTREKNIFGIGNIFADAKEITIKITSSDSTGNKLFIFEKSYKVK